MGYVALFQETAGSAQRAQGPEHALRGRFMSLALANKAGQAEANLNGDVNWEEAQNGFRAARGCFTALHIC